MCPASSNPPEPQLRDLQLRPDTLELPPRLPLSKQKPSLPSPFSEGKFAGALSQRRPLKAQVPLTLQTTPEVLAKEPASYALIPPLKAQHHRAHTHSQPGSRVLLTGSHASVSTSALADSALPTTNTSSSTAPPTASPTASPTAPPSAATPSAAPSSTSPSSEMCSPRSSAVDQAADMQARIMALQRSRSKRTGTPGTPGAASPKLSGRRRDSTASALSLNSSSQCARGSAPNGGAVLDDKLAKPASQSPASLSPPLDGESWPPKPVAANGFDPNRVISPTAACAAANGGPISLNRAPSFRSKQRSSLSARRGLRLNAMPPPEPEKMLSLPLASPHAAKVPAPKGNRGLFRDYRKYLDIETGSLRFNGKACVHAQGIEFSSGERFDISMDKLQFLCELGAGNYGTVQKVLHTRTGVFMAVKEIRLELDEASLQQIIMELDVLHRCETHSIISFYGAFFVEGSVYICMEYMDGGSVNKIYEGGVPEKFLKYIVRSVVAGLKELKERFNIIHRDVKPTNMLCSTSGLVKLCDFGVSGNLVASMARTNVGCQAYMAPERIKGDRFSAGRDPNQPLTYTTESDIWSLGLSIIEMANGSYPYPADMYMSIFSQLNAIVEEPSPALDPTQYSPEACDFVAKLLCKRPDQRPKYADIVRHPWLATDDCTPAEFGEFVRSRAPEQAHSSPLASDAS